MTRTICQLTVSSTTSTFGRDARMTRRGFVTQHAHKPKWLGIDQALSDQHARRRSKGKAGIWSIEQQERPAKRGA